MAFRAVGPRWPARTAALRRAVAPWADGATKAPGVTILGTPQC